MFWKNSQNFWGIKNLKKKKKNPTVYDGNNPPFY